MQWIKIVEMSLEPLRYTFWARCLAASGYDLKKNDFGITYLKIEVPYELNVTLVSLMTENNIWGHA